MKDILKEFWRGRVVYNPEQDMFGHVAGFSQQSNIDIMVQVEWADGDRYNVDPAIIVPL